MPPAGNGRKKKKAATVETAQSEPGPTKVTVVIVGGGASGVGLGALLAQCGMDHVVVERGRVGESFLSWPKVWLPAPAAR